MLVDGERLDLATSGATVSTGVNVAGDAEVTTVRWPRRLTARLTLRRTAAGRHLVGVELTADSACLVEAAGVSLRRDDDAAHLLVDGFHSWDWAGVRDLRSPGHGWWGAIWGTPGDAERRVAVSPLTGEVLSLRWNGDLSLEAIYAGAPAQVEQRTGPARSLAWRLGPGDGASLGTLRLGVPHPHRAAGLPWIDRVTEGPVRPLHGWMSWNCLGATVEPSHVLEAARELVPPGGVVLLDDGWMRFWGDWVENERFSAGLAELASQVTALGRRLGLWIAPFSVDPEAPAAGDLGGLLLRMPGGDRVLDERPTIPQWVLDPRRPEVRTHLHGLGQRLGRSGVSVLKADFLYQGCLTPRAGAFAALRRGIGALADGFRSRAGDAAPLWACGAPGPAVVGIADACRSGGDAVVNVPAHNRVQSSAGGYLTGEAIVRAQERNLAARSWLWGAQLTCDVDAVSAGRLGGHPTGVDDALLARWLRLATRSGGPLLDSDLLGGLDADRLALVRAALAADPGARMRPVDPLGMPAAGGSDFMEWQDHIPEEWEPA